MPRSADDAAARRARPRSASDLPGDRHRPTCARPSDQGQPVWIAPPRSAGRRRHDRHDGRQRAKCPRSSAPAGRARRRHTLEGYKPPAATRATTGWRKALTMRPTAVIDEVKAATLLGRGGAGFPAGTKWGFCPPGVWPRYLVVNGDESEPGTYKDRILMERDPHQLIEGCLIAGYAIGLAPGVPLRAGRDGPRPGAHRRRPQRGLRRRSRQEHPGHRLLRRHRPALGRRRLHRRRGDRRSSRASRATAGCPGSSRRTSRRPRASTCKPTIVNNVETLSNLPWLMINGATKFAELRRRRRRRARGCSPCPAT